MEFRSCLRLDKPMTVIQHRQGSTDLSHCNNIIRYIMNFFKGSKRNGGRKRIRVVDHPESGSKHGKGSKGGAEITITAEGNLSSFPEKRSMVSVDHTMKVVVAPWSFSVAEARERLDKLHRHPHSRVEGEGLPFGDVEGLWDSSSKAAWLKYMPTRREEERLERLFSGDKKYAQATDLNAILGRGKYRCKCSMGLKRWNSFVERERFFVKEHVSMLKENWGKNFYNKCSKFVADDPDVIKSTDSIPLSRKNVVERHKMPALNVGIGVDALQEQDHNEGLRARHCVVSKRPNTAHDDIYDDSYNNDDDFRIGVRPFSS